MTRESEAGQLFIAVMIFLFSLAKTTSGLDYPHVVVFPNTINSKVGSYRNVSISLKIRRVSNALDQYIIRSIRRRNVD